MNPELIHVEQSKPAEQKSLKRRYLEAIGKRCWPYCGPNCDNPHPKHRFDEYDQFRAIWTDEIWKWLYGDNHRKVCSLTALAWSVQHDRIGDGGRNTKCLNWSDRNQRVYLGDGLLEYLGLLKDDIEVMPGSLSKADKAAKPTL